MEAFSKQLIDDLKNATVYAATMEQIVSRILA